METLVHVIIPIFAIMICGFLAGRFSLIPSSGAWVLNAYIYYFALPALLYISLAEASRKEITSFSFIGVNVMTCAAVMLLALMMFSILFKKSFTESVLYGMASSYGNTGFLGIPLAVTAFGPEAAVPAAMVSFSCDLLLVTFVVIALEGASRHQTSILPALAGAVFKNPINVSLLLGSGTAFLQLPVPETIAVFTDTLGGAAGPTALFAIGLGLVQESRSGEKDRTNRKAWMAVFGLKLFVMPLTAWIFVTFFLDIQPLWAAVVILLSAMPTGAVVNVFAQQYRVLEKEIPAVVLASTVVSIGTLMILLLLLT
ncbi:AEC family transporter [Salibacterium sp. K-3]